jgi:hypothetical protein
MTTYRAYNLTRKEYVEGPLRDVGAWVSALICNDLLSVSVGRWAGDRIVVQALDARAGIPCYVNVRSHRHYSDITHALRLTPAASA